MRKRLLLVTVVVVLVLGVCAAPFISGQMVRHNYEAYLPITTSDGGVKITLMNYQSGWLSSDAQVFVEILNPQLRKLYQEKILHTTNAGENGFTVDQHIEHGPIIYDTKKSTWYLGLGLFHSARQLPAEFMQNIKLADTTQPLVQIDTLMTFLGNYESHYKVQAFTGSVKADNGELQYDVKGVEGNTFFSPGGHRFHGAVVSPGLTITSANKIEWGLKGPGFAAMSGVKTLNIPSLQVSFDVSQQPSGLWMGSSDVSIPEITLTDGQKDLFKVTGIMVTSSEKETAGNVDFANEYTLNKLQIGAAPAYGPAHLQLSGAGLDVQAMVRLRELVRQFDVAPSTTATDQNRQALTNAILAIIKPGSEVHVNTFDVTTPDGVIRFNGNAIWPQNTPPAGGDVVKVFTNANLTSQLRVPVALVDTIISKLGAVPFFNHQQAPATAPAPAITPPGLVVDPATAKPVAVQPAKELKKYDDMVAELTKQGKLTADLAVVLHSLQQTKVPAAVYETNLNNLVATKHITPQVANELQQQYILVEAEAKLPPTAAPVGQPVATVVPATPLVVAAAVPPAVVIPAAAPVTPEQPSMLEQQAKMMLDTWIKMGYVTKDGNDYLISVSRVNGTLQVNGKNM